MKTLKIEMKWAIYFALMTLTWMLIEKLAGLHDKHIDKHQLFSNFIIIPAVTMYVFALLTKRNNYYRGKISYKQAFISGAFLSVFITVLTPLTQTITSTLISPLYFENVINYSVSHGFLKLEEAQTEFNLSNYIVMSTVGALVMGLFTTAIVALFIRKK